MSKKLIVALVAVSLSVFVVTALAFEETMGAQLSNTQKPLPSAGTNPAAGSAFQIKPVVVEVKQVIGVVGEPKTITVMVKSTDGFPVKKGDVKLMINGTPLQVLAAGMIGGSGIFGAGAVEAILPTDDNGIVSIPIAPRPDKDKPFHMGANTIEAEFTGKTATNDIKYMSGKATGTFSILKGISKIVPIDKNSLCLTYQGDPTTCKGLAKRSVIVKSNGQQVGNLMTENHNGATYDGRVVIPSQFDQYSSCQIVFQGDDFFLPAAIDRTPCRVKDGY